MHWTVVGVFSLLPKWLAEKGKLQLHYALWDWACVISNTLSLSTLDIAKGLMSKALSGGNYEACSVQ